LGANAACPSARRAAADAARHTPPAGRRPRIGGVLISPCSHTTGRSPRAIPSSYVISDMLASARLLPTNPRRFRITFTGSRRPVSATVRAARGPERTGCPPPLMGFLHHKLRRQGAQRRSVNRLLADVLLRCLRCNTARLESATTGRPASTPCVSRSVTASGDQSPPGRNANTTSGHPGRANTW
jgi:hypothetical protein